MKTNNPGANRPRFKPVARRAAVLAPLQPIKAGPAEPFNAGIERILETLSEFEPHVQNRMLETVLTEVIKRRYSDATAANEHREYTGKNVDALMGLNGERIYKQFLDNNNKTQ